MKAFGMRTIGCSMDRRGFIRGLSFASAAGVLGGCRVFTGAAGDFDEHLTVFLSDIHVSPGKYHSDRLRMVVAEILKMDPLPRRVVSFGDLAYLYGHKEDYVESRPILQPIVDAGIELVHGMGNHDRRDNFLEVWPEYAKKTLLKDRIVSEVSLGDCDLLLLDTLHQIDGSSSESDVKRGWITPGQFKGEQRDWLFDEVKRRKRPFLLGAHHAPTDVPDGNSAELVDLVMSTPNCLGWVQGHDHVWRTGLLRPTKHGWGDNTFKRILTLPSTGHWGDIGYVVCRTSPHAARMELEIRDRYFPNPEKRVSPLDDDIVAEKRGSFMTFRY